VAFTVAVVVDLIVAIATRTPPVTYSLVLLFAERYSLTPSG
jgi:hypothetical protein